MCSHYQAVEDARRLEKEFGVKLIVPAGKSDIWPGYKASFIRVHPHADSGDDAVPSLECLTGLFGLVPHWAKDIKACRHTFNSRSETAAQKPSFRDAWRRRQRCIIPAEAIYEPDWRSGKAVATRIARSDGEPMGIAGLWSSWQSPAGEFVLSFTMLTINAQDHSLMQRFHKPDDEKRMVVILPTQRYHDWLNANVEHGMEFMKPITADLLVDAPFQP